MRGRRRRRRRRKRFIVGFSACSQQPPNQVAGLRVQVRGAEQVAQHRADGQRQRVHPDPPLARHRGVQQSALHARLLAAGSSSIESLII